MRVVTRGVSCVRDGPGNHAQMGVNTMKVLSVYVAKLGETFPLKLPESLHERMMNHGAKQLVNDEHSSLVKKDRSGKIVFTGTDAEFRAAVRKAVVDKITALEAGNWNSRSDPMGLSAEEWAAVEAIRAKRAKASGAPKGNGA